MDRARAIGRIEAGESCRAVARAMGVNHKSINELLRKYRNTNDVADLPRPGRPKLTTRQQDRFIVNAALRSRSRTGPDIQSQLERANPHQRRMSTQTVRNRLHAAGLRSRSMVKKPLLTPRHKVARLQWTREHVRTTHAGWSNVLFTDECRFSLHRSDGRVRAWRRRGERHTACCVQPTVAYGGGSIMVWAGISANGKTDLVIMEGTMTSRRYITDVLEPHVIPYAGAIGDNFMLMHDNARPHVSAVVRDYLDSESVEVKEWPACSPDLNPIEHLWSHMKRNVYQKMGPNSHFADLRRYLLEEWDSIPQALVRKLVYSMRKRCQQCIDNHGGYTSY